MSRIDGVSRHVRGGASRVVICPLHILHNNARKERHPKIIEAFAAVPCRRRCGGLAQGTKSLSTRRHVRALHQWPGHFCSPVLPGALVGYVHTLDSRCMRGDRETRTRRYIASAVHRRLARAQKIVDAPRVSSLRNAQWPCPASMMSPAQAARHMVAGQSFVTKEMRCHNAR